MADFSRNPMGVIEHRDPLRPSTMRFSNIIPERFPPDPTSNTYPTCADKDELSYFFSCHWNSSHHFVPVLEEQCCTYMFQKIMPKISGPNVFANEDSDVRPILKAILFAVAAWSAKYLNDVYRSKVYYNLARTAIDASENIASFEYLLANTLLVGLPLPTHI